MYNIIMQSKIGVSGERRKMSRKKNIIIISILAILMTAAAAVWLISAKAAESVPEITLKGRSAVTIYIGNRYKEPGYTAMDGTGNDLTDKVQVSAPDMLNHGRYKIRYKVTGTTGKSVAVYRTVRVLCKKADSSTSLTSLSVLMYHKVYDPEDPSRSLNSNCISTTALEEELEYLVNNDYYFPTWEEVREYVDGSISLPEKSVVLTFDDGSPLFIKYGVPLLEKYDVRATAFIIASKNGKVLAADKYKHITLQSHSYNMHRAGGSIGHGGIFTALNYDEGMSDLKRSIKILGNSDAFAYPYGDYTEECEKEVKDAGFRAAVTTAYGRVSPGADPYLLPRIRICGNITLEEFEKLL